MKLLSKKTEEAQTLQSGNFAIQLRNGMIRLLPSEPAIASKELDLRAIAEECASLSELRLEITKREDDLKRILKAQLEPGSYSFGEASIELTEKSRIGWDGAKLKEHLKELTKEFETSVSYVECKARRKK